MSTFHSLKERLISHFTRYTLSVRCAHSVHTLLQGESRDAILHISQMIELCFLLMVSNQSAHSDL